MTSICQVASVPTSGDVRAAMRAARQKAIQAGRAAVSGGGSPRPRLAAEAPGEPGLSARACPKELTLGDAWAPVLAGCPSACPTWCPWCGHRATQACGSKGRCAPWAAVPVPGIPPSSSTGHTGAPGPRPHCISPAPFGRLDKVGRAWKTLEGKLQERHSQTSRLHAAGAALLPFYRLNGAAPHLGTLCIHT